MINKKAGMFDLFVLIALVFIVAVVSVLIYYAINLANTKILEQAPNLQDNSNNNTNVTEIINNTVGKANTAIGALKWIAPLFIFAYVLSIIISAMLVRTHPIWIVGYIFIVVIATILAVPISNAYETLQATPILAATFFQFPTVNIIMSLLPIWVAVVGLIAGMLMYMNLDHGGYYE